MDNKSNLAQLRYLEEVAVNLRRNAFEVERIEDQHLPVSWNGSHLCRISGKGSVLYRQEIVDALGAQAELDQVVDIANITREYMTMMEYGSRPASSAAWTAGWRKITVRHAVNSLKRLCGSTWATSEAAIPQSIFQKHW